MPKLYVFAIAAYSTETRVNNIEPYLVIDNTPQHAAETARRQVQAKYPNHRIDVGVPNEVPQDFIDQIREL